jgi:hypothetical protein
MSDMEIYQQLEPMSVHFLEELTFDGVSRDRAYDRIHAAFGTERGVIIVGPVFDLARREDLQAVKAAANITLSERFTMVA